MLGSEVKLGRGARSIRRSGADPGACGIASGAYSSLRVTDRAALQPPSAFV